jgi:ribulose 1,5-bisphosphate synthetase/thiazole synthase
MNGLILLSIYAGATAALTPTIYHCDVVVAGGSTASLAAAITAAEADVTVRVCFTEITDWPGGQMTAGGVPAIDFDGPNHEVVAIFTCSTSSRYVLPVKPT